MDTGVLVAVIVVVVVVLLLLGLLASRRRSSQREVQAREALRSAEALAPQAETSRAAADQQAQRVRSLEEVLAAEKVQADRLGRTADEQVAEVDQLRAKAHELAPHLVNAPDAGSGRHALSDTHAAPSDTRAPVADGAVSGSQVASDHRGAVAHSHGVVSDRHSVPGTPVPQSRYEEADVPLGGSRAEPAHRVGRSEAPITDPDGTVTDREQADAFRGRDTDGTADADRPSELDRTDADVHRENADREPAKDDSIPARAGSTDPAELPDHGSVGSRPLDGARSATGDPVLPLDQRLRDRD